ncbi:hypothetical protein LJC72_09235 [Bacteroides sp. OttesenSCG-928-D19]|nr:hypothetical protein [Bacteroides sp. OttesenSCG-928-N06]MDL2305504.1 hypothetical protein [Bacteroides sp. OttesenSCG-928-D19]
MKKFLFIYFCLQSSINSAFSTTVDSLRVDSLLSYYEKYFNDPTDPIVLAAADTLWTIAQQYNNLSMMKKSMGAKLDYYYYGSSENATDSVIVWVDRIKKHAKKIGNHELYFWVWSARLVNHYIKLGEYNIALVEAEKMLVEAEKSGYKENIAQCYFTLANIYSAKGLAKKAKEFMLQEIELFEKYKLKRPHISFQYSDAAGICIEEGEKELAAELLEKAIKYARTSYHKVSAKLGYATYYLHDDNLSAARKELEECRKMYEDEPSIKRHIHYFYTAEINYFIKTGKYDEALKVAELKQKELERTKNTVELNLLNKKMANIYWAMGKKEEAGALYRSYLMEEEKEKERNEEITTGEFATLLNMQRLNEEKTELEKISQEKHIQNIQLIVVSLAILLFCLLFFLYIQRKLNRKLKRSRDKLDEKNRILMQAEVELSKAKEMAENSSRMKTVFIQNMSHEIRTPLNSIVGFSAVLADLFTNEENEDIAQFASLIESNSQLLLNLINDILEISALDNDTQLASETTDVNNCCLMAVESVKPFVKDGVEFIFNPGKEPLFIKSDSDRITQVLRNLLNNAAKFTSAGSISLTYELTNADKQLLFTVTDTGIGIPKGEEEHIFERFVKLNEFTQGAGLGLSICRMIAEKMGGYLIVDKEYTEGTRLMFCISI